MWCLQWHQVVFNIIAYFNLKVSDKVIPAKVFTLFSLKRMLLSVFQICEARL